MAEEKKPEEPAKPSGMPKVMVIGFIAMVVVVETILFLFMVPNAEDVARLAEQRLVENVEASMDADGEETIEENEEFKEISLGTYEILFTPPGTEQRKHRVGFDLVGVVLAEDPENAGLLFKEREGRFRDRLLEEVRNASLDELEEMALIKRRIFATSNELIKRDDNSPILNEIVFRDFSVLEM